MAISLADLFPMLRSAKGSAADSTSAHYWERSLARRRPASHKRAAAPRASAISFETFEPRLLLSADLTPAAASGLADGLDQLDIRVDAFLIDNALLGERVPLLLEIKTDAGGGLVNEAPTIGELFRINVDANLDGEIDDFLVLDDGDETVLRDIDDFDPSGQGRPGQSDGVVTATEFLEYWLWHPVSEWLRDEGQNASTEDFADFLKELENPFGLFGNDTALDALGDFSVEFRIIDAKVVDSTEDPDAEYTFSLGFELLVTRDAAPLDLGLQADGLKLLYFTGSAFDPKLPTVGVESKFSFGFEFGVRTGGQGTVDAQDFFIRRADPLTLSVTSQESDLNFNLNVGFLGAKVEGGSLDLQADVVTQLLDPDDPAVLGLTSDQRGVEVTNGVVTANAALPTDGVIDHDAGFVLRIGNLGIAVPVTVTAAATQGNTSATDLLADVRQALVNAGLAVNANFSSANLVNAVLVNGDTLRFTLTSTTDTPLDFSNETIGASGILSVVPAGENGNQFEYATDQAFLLSVGGALPRLVRVNFADPSHTHLGLDDGQVASVVPLVAPNAPSAFNLSGNATFEVTVWKSDGTSATGTFTVAAAQASGNSNAGDLALDIDTQFLAQQNSIAQSVLVEANAGGRLQFRAIDGQNVTAIRVQASGTAVTEAGFAADTVVGLQLKAANAGLADLNEAAIFRLTLETGSAPNIDVDTYVVTVPDLNRASLAELAADVNQAMDLAVGSSLVDAFVDGNRIVLAATNTSVLALSVLTENQSLDDLVLDVNRALATAGLAGQVQASANGPALQLQTIGAAAGQSLEISRTLTFDAGITFAELQPEGVGGSSTDELFDAAKGQDSNVEINLPVKVLAGLEDASTAANDDWNPAKVAIIGEFSPFDADSAVADYDPIAKRFTLLFTFDPILENQDSPNNDPPSADPGELVLYNMAELLNFNLLSAESMVGLIESLGSVLEQLTQSEKFTGFELPFADANLSDFLNFVDQDLTRASGLFDVLLFDNGGDGFDGSESGSYLLQKRKDQATGKWFLIPAFSTAQQLGTVLQTVLNAPVDGPTGINATYDPVSNKLTYEVDLLAGARTALPGAGPADPAPESDKRDFQYGDGLLDPFGKLAIDPAADLADRQVSIAGRTGLQMTLGIDLTTPPGLNITGDTKLSLLNGGFVLNAPPNYTPPGSGVNIKQTAAITGTVDVLVVPDPDGAAPQTPPPQQQLDSFFDAVFSISLDGGATSTTVTIPKEATVNRTMADLAVDVNNALAAEGLANDVVAGYDGQRLVLSAVDPAKELMITFANFVVAGKLGIVTGATSTRTDFIITDRTGGPGGIHEITLDNLGADPTIQDVIDRIALETGGAVVAELNATLTGLRLVDKTGGTGEFRVSTTNGSLALLQLGFLRAGDEGRWITDPTDGDPTLAQDPNVINGDQIGQTQLGDRFFVRDAQIRVDGLRIEMPDNGVTGSALFGIVGLDTVLSGAIEANMIASLKGPTGLPGSEVSLAQLYDGSGVLTNPELAKPQTLAYSLQAGGPIQVGQRIFSGSGGRAVVVSVDNGVLGLADVEGSFQNGDLLTQPGVIGLAAGTVQARPDYGVLDYQVTVRPFDDIAFSDPAFASGFGLISGQTYAVPTTIKGLGDPFTTPDPTLPDVDVDLSGIGDLAAFQQLSYSHVQAALDELLRILGEVESNFALLNTELPAIGKSVSDLLELVDGFARGVANANEVLSVANAALQPDALELPALSLQDLPRALRSAFGLPVGVDPNVGDAVDWVKFRFDEPGNMLLVDLSMNEVVSTKLGLDIETGDGIPNITSGGVLKAAGVLDVRLNFGIDLATPSNAYLFDTSNIAATLKVQGEGQEYAGGEGGLGLVFRAALGPLAVFIRDGEALIDVKFRLPGLDFDGSDRKLLSQVEWSDFLTPIVDKEDVAIVLPMFYGGEGPNDLLGEYEAIGKISDPIDPSAPDFSGIVADIGTGVIAYDPFENILLAVDALDIYLQELGDRIASEVLSVRLPLVGDQLADVQFIEEFRNTLIRTLKEGIENAINPNPDTIIQSLLVTGLGQYLVGGAGGIAYSNTGSGTGRDRRWSFTVAGSRDLEVVDFDLGIPNLEFDVRTAVDVKFDWTLKIAFGVNYGEGAYIVVSDGEELDLKLDISLPLTDSTKASGTLGFLGLDVTDPGSDTGAKIDFGVDVSNDGSADPLLGFADLGSLATLATIAGTDEDGSGSDMLTLHLVTDAAPGLPELRTNLVIDWSLPATDVATLDGDAVAPGIKYIAYEQIVLDAGSVAEQLLGPLFDDISGFIAPFMPVVDAISAPIPILSDIAGEDFTILDLAGIFGKVDADFLEAVADILDVIAAINDFLSAPDLPIGDYILFDGPGGIPDEFDPTDPNYELADAEVKIEAYGDGSTTAGLSHDAVDYANRIEGNSFLKAVKNGDLAEGLTIPILTDPRQAFRLLLDQDAVLIDYELPPLKVGFDYYQLFPVFGPLAVSIEIGFEFGIDLNSVGFDTNGYRRYAETGYRNEGLIFDGFYFYDLNDSGVDTPEVTFLFSLVGAAELNLGIARAGVAGGIEATINFDWHDPIADGRVHISEMIGSVEAAGGNPLAIFDVGGALSFQLAAFLEISLIGFRKDIPITPQTDLFDFNDDSERAPLLGTKVGDTLFLNMGPSAEDRLHGDTSDGNEFFRLKYDNGKVLVWSDELGVKDDKPQEFSGIKHIVGLGGQGDDVIELTGFDGADITAEFDGGAGDDRIEYKGSSGSADRAGAVIRGGVGNDTLIGGDANDQIFGGEGNDVIKGGGGFDQLFGDFARVSSSGTRFISAQITDGDGDDTIEGGAADDVIFGNGGSDKLRGDDGMDLLIGDGGRFNYSLSGNHVDIGSLRPAAYVPPTVDTPTPKDPEQISQDIDALYDHVASRISATDLGVGGNDVIEGGAGDDLILGGSGDDLIKGGANADVILAGKGFDEVHGDGGDDQIFGGDQADTLYGGDGNDVMSGGAGNDFMHGDADNDVMKGDAGADIMFGDAGDDQVFGQTEPDVLFGGAGHDLVVGGTGADYMFGDDGIVAKLDPGTNDGTGAAARIIGIGNVALLNGQWRDDDPRSVDVIVTDVLATDGNDIMSGDAGDDIMLGGGGSDRMGGDVDPRLPSFPHPTEISEDVLIGDGGRITFDQRRYRLIETVISQAPVGPSYNDTIYGDNGNDYIFGGLGGDFLFGGHGKVVTGGVVGAFRGPTDSIASDNDVIVADNGELQFAGETIPANFGQLERVRTTDVLNTTGGADYAEGEIGDDVIFGGVNNSVDTLFGNVGNDVILGDNGEIDFDLDDTGDLTTLDLIRSYLDGLGGTDVISGNAGFDVLVGGTGGDEMYGDDATASAAADDKDDVMLGDNADVFLIDKQGRLTVQVADMTEGSAVDLITTTDFNDDYGGADTMSGNAGFDVMLGGVNDGGIDKLYGDRASPTTTTIANDLDDIMLGDNGLLDFTLGIDLDRDTLDLIRSFEDDLGGVDELSGGKGQDVGIGGTDGDTIFGDDANYSAGAADLADILLGDNADIFLVALAGATGSDLKTVLSAAVDYLLTTDEENPQYGGIDRISGNAGGDIIAGGVQGDYLWGDREVPTPTSSGLDGNDIMLGDNARLEWRSDGRFADSAGLAAFIDDNNQELYDFFIAGADTDLGTLDLITTAQPTKGGRDRMWGDEGSDLMFGGTDTDIMRGDDGDEDYETGQANQDVMFGDHGRLYPQFSRFLAADGTLVATDVIHSRNFFAIDMGVADGGQGDVMYGEEGDDVMLGQQGDDRMWGGLDDDDMIGGHNRPGGYDELAAGSIGATLLVPQSEGPDTNVAMNDVMDGGFGDDAMAGDNAVIWRRGDDLSPRFRTLTETTIYTTTETSIIANIGGEWQSDPEDAVGRDIELLDHSDTTADGLYGKDVMAGGADDDVMFGQLGDDLMQGDGAIETADVGAPFISRRIDVTDSGMNPDTDATLYFNIPEAPTTDGDDYMEGNGGRDLMYGGLGQDDMIGGSSELFGLTTEAMRPDDSDTMFGGAGIDTGRNHIGDATQDASNVITPTDDGNGLDADYMMGDNANVYRLVTSDGSDAFLRYNYDAAYGTKPAYEIRIIPRAMQQLDYTLGGADYYEGDYTADGQAQLTGQPADNGAADLIHGESGDDVIFGMTGSDVLFGDGQDDDIVGGYGHDWISGGTGQDGILGDDGLVLTSRNSTLGEPLNGIAGLLDRDPDTKYSDGNVLDELIATPGSIQTAVINKSGELKKTIDLVPFSYDSGWIGIDDEYPDNMGDSPFADDVIFGGLGSDWLHGGSGDDAISGAEALVAAYVPVYDGSGVATGVWDLGFAAVGIESALIDNPTNTNPGNVLAFNKEDTDGQHLNNRFRAGEFRLYDEYDPRRTIELDPSGNLWKLPTQGAAFAFLLNFAEGEGVIRPAGTVPKSTGQSASSYPQVWDDGDDKIFGDLGNDWIVGGTGRDNAYGGWGNDLLNVDDNHTTNGGLNDIPDTHPTYEDRAYGGAGRDVLIGNTGGDRLIDWVGEYNSYLVPYAPFGQASVSRTLQPFLPEFLYALSEGDGADSTRASYTDDPRNGEPAAELGLVLQKDQAWQDQTGAPADPQAGNIPGGKRDVLRSADFSGNQAQGFVAEAGAWTVKNGRYEVSPLAGSGTTDAISLFNADAVLPSYFEIVATINAVKPTAGFKANAYVIFDYVSPTSFKFAGINVSTNKFEIGQRTAAGWQVLSSINVLVKQDIDYNLLIAVNGNTVTAVLNGKQSLSYAFTPRQDADGFTYLIRDGMIGLGGDNARSRIDNVRVQVIPPAITYAASDAFDGPAPTLLRGDVGNWLMQGGRYVATPAAGAPFALAGNDIAVGANAFLQLDTVVQTAATGGIVFDMYSPTDFKWAAVSVATQQVLIGHYTAKGGWVVDAAVSRSLAAGTDYALSVSLKGTTVSVTLNGQAVLSKVFNSTVVDGAVGAFARGGSASFDSFGLGTDDARLGAAATATSSSTATSTTTKTAATSTSKLSFDSTKGSVGALKGWRIDWNSNTLKTFGKRAAGEGVAKARTEAWHSDFVLNLGERQAQRANYNLRVML